MIGKSSKLRQFGQRGAGIAGGALVVLLAACSTSAQSGGSKATSGDLAAAAKRSSPAPSSQPTASAPAQGDKLTSTNALGSANGPIKASYLGKAQALGLDVCSGNLDVAVNLSALLGGSVELFQIPDSAVTCSVIGAIDLKGILGSFGQQASSGSQAVADKLSPVISVTSLGGSTFKPPRPMLPSLFSGTADALAHLDVKTAIDMTAKDGKVTHGMTEVKMLSYDQPYTVATGGQVFPHVVDFIILNSGFDGADKAANLLFDSMEFHISLDPIAILSITFKGTLQSVLVAADAGQASNANGTVAAGAANGSGTAASASPSFITSVLSAFPSVPVQMTMDLVDQTGLTDALIAAAKDHGNGDSLGGKPIAH